MTQSTSFTSLHLITDPLIDGQLLLVAGAVVIF